MIVDDPHRIAAGRVRLPGVRFLTPSVYFLSALPSKLATANVIAIAAAAFLMSCVATLYPSSRAARMRPAEALRNEQAQSAQAAQAAQAARRYAVSWKPMLLPSGV